jgi:hypothetical protein
VSPPFGGWIADRYAARYVLSRARGRCAGDPPPSVPGMLGKKRKGGREILDGPIDLAFRIGSSARTEAFPAAPGTIRRFDGPIESDRAARGRLLIGANEAPLRPTMIGQNEALAEAAEVVVEDPARAGRPTMIGLDEPFAAPIAEAIPDPAVTEPISAAIPSTREAPLAGEMDLVVTPLLTPDDWHHFELALRRIPGVGPLRIQYYRAGILKLRLQWAGPNRFAHAVASVPGYRVGILGEDRSTVQIRVMRA